jgi:hypothetical protein
MNSLLLVLAVAGARTMLPHSWSVVRAEIDAPQGLECTGYFILNNRTKHLRRQLYITVREERPSPRSQELCPQLWWEHFPVIELVREGWWSGAHLGEGDPGERIIFECHGPAAREGARIISETMYSLGPLLRGSLYRRGRAMRAAELEYQKYVGLMGSLHVDRNGNPVPQPLSPARVSPAYRPGSRCGRLR